MMGVLRVSFVSIALLFIYLSAHKTDSAKVLLMPFNHKSDIMYFTKLGAALVDDGHEVWVLALSRFEEIIKESGVLPMMFSISQQADYTAGLEDFMSERPGESVTYDFQTIAMAIYDRYCNEVMTNRALLDAIHEQHFDLMVVDGAVGYTCMLMIPYIYDVPFITVSNFHLTPWVAGVVGLPSTEPELETLYSNKMNFWQRLYNLHIWVSTYNNPASQLFSRAHMEKYAGNKPKISFTEVLKKSEMFLLHFEIMCLDYPRVSAPNYQFLGASTAFPPKPLPADLDEFVSGAEHGIVVMSLGTHKAYHFFWAIIKNKVLKALGQLKQRALVQYDCDEMPNNVPDNILLKRWLPQNDLLGNPKTKLFVSHGGGNGQYEAVYHGVPSLIIPIATDQPYSGERVERHGYGKHVRNKNTITADELYDMMTEIIYNETYTKNIKKCSAIVRSMPPASERFVFWVNHILQFGGAHLRPPGLDMPLYEVLMLDVVAFLVVCCHVLIIVMWFVIRCIYCSWISVNKEKNE